MIASHTARNRLRDVSRRPSHRSSGAIGAFEVIAAVAVIAALTAIAAGVYNRVISRAQAAKSSVNLRQLVAANYAFAADHGDRFCPTWDRANLVRWHGGRDSLDDPFDARQGFLGEYLDAGQAIHCPLFHDFAKRAETAAESAASFERGAGGYGYNDEYLGREPGKRSRIVFPFNGRSLKLFSLGLPVAAVTDPGNTVMFATTALSRVSGLQEYPICHPRREVLPDGSLGADYQPSVHFRANGRALVAWCDGRITLEPPSELGGPNVYGGNNARDQIGWFGPGRDNGFWNPRFAGIRRRDRHDREEGAGKDPEEPPDDDVDDAEPPKHP